MTHVIEELLLLAYDDDMGVDNSYTSLALGLGAGVLLDLALQDRIEIIDDRVVVVGSSPTGHPVLDDALGQMNNAPRRQKPGHWINKFYSRSTTRKVRDGLVEQGVLYYQKGRSLGVIPYPQYLPNDPTVEREVRQRLENAVKQGAADSAKTTALAGVVHALRMEKRAVPEMYRSKPRLEVRQALQQVASDSPDDGMGASIKASRNAINAAMWAAVAAAAAGGG